MPAPAPSPTSLNLALVGCGAISQSFYLPAIAARRASFGEIFVVDPNEQSLAAAAAAVDAKTARTLSDIRDDLGFVIVATPNALHRQHAEAALARNAHVLIEKPFVLWPEEGRRLIRRAREQKRLLAVNQTRRMFPLALELRRLIASGAFGKLRSVVHHEGAKLTWPYKSGAAFDRNAQRTGVIMDLGVHVLDFYQFLLGSAWTLRNARHDGFAGPEGLAHIEMTIGEAPVSIRLSRYLRQDNLAVLTFDDTEVVIRLHDWNTYTIRKGEKKARHVTAAAPAPSYAAFAEILLANFVAAAAGRQRLVCDASDALHTIVLLDRIYETAERYPATVGAA
jgi:predicted dehydrogenase